MARHRKPSYTRSYSRSYRQPSLLNTLMFKFAALNPLAHKEFPMSSRRNILIRAVTSIVGDIAVAMAMASACIWLIEAATLGLFLSFLVWLLGSLIALALSQYEWHPAVAIVLSSQKLDDGINALNGLSDRVTRFMRSALQNI